VPRGVDLIHAAAVPETFFTVWTNVFERGRLGPGESILVHGGSSGIGTTAIQLARVLGARVFATAGSAEKCAACEALGAERAFNYRETDFVAALKEATGGRGVDVVLDIVGGEYLQRNIESLAMDGRLVLIGQQGGPIARINTVPILQRRLTIVGSTLRARSVAEKGAIAKAVHEHVWPLLESGAVRVILHRTFPLRDASEAHRMMESSSHIGKLVLPRGLKLGREGQGGRKGRKGREGQEGQEGQGKGRRDGKREGREGRRGRRGRNVERRTASVLGGRIRNGRDHDASDDGHQARKRS
jgi:putative PIG3 family NAD(P)H quinone oxidoreductase